MADSSGIRAGRGFMELSVRGPWERQIDAAAKKIKSIGDNITDIGKKTLAIGSAITAPLLIAAQRFASMGDQITKAAQRTGIGAESLQELKYAAEQSDVAFEDLQGGIRKMQKTLFDAASGSDEAVKSLAGIGLTIADLKALKPDEQFQLIGDRINNITDPTARAAVAMQIFGKSGTGLLPLFAEGADGMAALRDRARELGIVFSSQDAQAATLFGDTLADLWKQLNAIVFQIGAAIAQALQPFAEGAIRCLRAVIDWTRENRSLAIGLLAAGAALIVLGSGLVGVGVAIKSIGFAFSGITSGFKLVSAAAGLLLNPVVLVTAALAALGIYLLYTTENGGKLLSWLGDRFNELSDTAKEAFGGIADALKAGDIALAAQIMFVGLKLAWIQGTHDLQVIWINFKTSLLQGVVEVGTAIEKTVAKTAFNLQYLFRNAVAGVADIFTNIAEKYAIESVTLDLTFGKITRAQRDEQVAFIKEQYQKQRNVSAGNLDKENLAREDALRGQLASIETQRQALLAAADQNANDEIAGLETQKAELQDQLATLRSQARKEREQGGAPFPSLVDPGKLNGLDQVIANRASLDVKSAGLFNASSLQSLQSSTTDEAIRKASEETSRNTKVMADLLRGALSFR